MIGRGIRPCRSALWPLSKLVHPVKVSPTGKLPSARYVRTESTVRTSGRDEIAFLRFRNNSPGHPPPRPHVHTTIKMDAPACLRRSESSRFAVDFQAYFSASALSPFSDHRGSPHDRFQPDHARSGPSCPAIAQSPQPEAVVPLRFPSSKRRFGPTPGRHRP